MNYLGKLFDARLRLDLQVCNFEDKFDYKRVKKNAKPHWKTSTTIETINGGSSLKLAYG